MRKLLLLVLPLAATTFFVSSCSDAPVQPAAPTNGSFNRANTEMTPLDEWVWNDCCGELIHLTGNVRVTSNSTVDRNGTTHWSFSVSFPNAGGVGESTGINYVATGASKETSKYGDGGLPASYSFTSVRHLVGTGADGHECSWNLVVVFHVTVDADGNPTVVIDHYDTNCEPAP